MIKIGKDKIIFFPFIGKPKKIEIEFNRYTLHGLDATKWVINKDGKTFAAKKLFCFGFKQDYELNEEKQTTIENYLIQSIANVFRIGRTFPDVMCFDAPEWNITITNQIGIQFRYSGHFLSEEIPEALFIEEYLNDMEKELFTINYFEFKKECEEKEKR